MPTKLRLGLSLSSIRRVFGPADDGNRLLTQALENLTTQNGQFIVQQNETVTGGFQIGDALLTQDGNFIALNQNIFQILIANHDAVADEDTADEVLDLLLSQANEVIKTSDPVAAAEMQKKNPNVDIELTEDELDEISTTGGVPAYQTPFAFSTKAQDKKKNKMKYESVQKALDKKYAELIESYSKFATGNPKSTPSQTVNSTIKEVAKKLQEIEQLVRYTSRLKTESGIAGSTYGKSTKNALHRISERLLKISERVRSLGE